VADLESRPAAVQTVSVKARPTAAGLGHGAARPGSLPAPDGGELATARVAEAQSRARERGDRQRQALRPLGVVFLAVVVTASAQAHPAPGVHGAGLAVAVLLVAYAAAVATAVSVGWARRGPAAQAAVSALIGGCGVALAVLQPHGPVEIAASLGVWIAAVRLPAVPAALAAGAITAALALAVGLTRPRRRPKGPEQVQQAGEHGVRAVMVRGHGRESRQDRDAEVAAYPDRVPGGCWIHEAMVRGCQVTPHHRDQVLPEER
jgi:hypothetical protein